jgi:hypothetical protein
MAVVKRLNKELEDMKKNDISNFSLGTFLKAQNPSFRSISACFNAIITIIMFQQRFLIILDTFEKNQFMRAPKAGSNSLVNELLIVMTDKQQ